jgi:hypothetical protein
MSTRQEMRILLRLRILGHPKERRSTYNPYYLLLGGRMTIKGIPHSLMYRILHACAEVSSVDRSELIPGYGSYEERVAAAPVR